MMSNLPTILALIAMIALVFTRPSLGGKSANKRAAGSKKTGDTLILGKGVKLGPAEIDPERPGKVSYQLMKDNRLPSPTQLRLKRMIRPIVQAWRTVVPGKIRVTKEPGSRPSRQSAELQNFLDARNKEIARRKAESDLKRGPEDQLH
jgi:hypothetical protein